MVAIGDYDDRYVIPKRHGEVSPDAFAEQGSCGIDFSAAGAGAIAGAGMAAASGLGDGLEEDPLAASFDLRDQLVQRRPGDGNGSANG